MKYVFAFALLFLCLALSAQEAHVYHVWDAHYASIDQNPPENFFDGSLSTDGTPRKMQDVYGFYRVVHGLYHPFSMYSQVAGSFDLTGAQDLDDTTNAFVVTAIQAYSHNAGSGQSIWFFNGNQFYRPAKHDRPMVLADPHSYGVDAIATMTNLPSSDGWITVTLPTPTPMRYLDYRVGGDTISQQVCKISEIKIIGYYNCDTATLVHRVWRYPGAMPDLYTPNLTYHKRNANNAFGWYGPQTRSHYGAGRVFTQTNYTDTIAAQGIPNKLKFPLTKTNELNLFSDLNPTTIQQAQNEGILITLTNHGASAYIQANSSGTTPLDSVNGHAVYYGNYRRYAWMVYNQALVGGTTPTSSTNAFVGTWANGQGIFNPLLVGNEVDGHDAINNWDQCVMARAAYDGFEGLLMVGSQHVGAKYGDPNLKVNMPAFTDWDARKLLNMFYYSNMFFNDKHVPFDQFEMHKYPDITDIHRKGIQRDLDQKIGSHSATPEQFETVKRADSLWREIYAFYGFDMIGDWTEVGYSHDTHIATTETEAANYDQSATQAVGSWNSHQVVAAIALRNQLQAMATQFRITYRYSWLEQAPGAIGRFFQMGYGENLNGSFEMVTKYAEAYVNNSSDTRFGGYSFKSIVAQGDSLSTVKFKFQKYGTDSVCYVVWLGTLNGSTQSQSISLPGFSQAAIFDPSFTSDIGTSTTQATTGSAITTTISEMPRFFFGRELAAAPSCTTNSSPANTSTVSSSVNLIWNSASGATFYDVYLYNGGTPPGIPTYTVSTTTKNVTGLTPGATYHWYVVPGNSNGSASGCATSNTQFTIQTAPPVKIWRRKRK